MFFVIIAGRSIEGGGKFSCPFVIDVINANFCFERIIEIKCCRGR